MNPKLAQIIFIIFNVLAIPAVGFAIYDFFFVKNAIANSVAQIPFDSGTYYLLLMSIFWVLSFIQVAGLRNAISKVLIYANPVVVLWFIAMLILANVFPYYLHSQFESSGYIKCKDPREISRVSRGESSIYVKGNCANISIESP